MVGVRSLRLAGEQEICVLSLSRLGKSLACEPQSLLPLSVPVADIEHVPVRDTCWMVGGLKDSEGRNKLLSSLEY